MNPPVSSSSHHSKASRAAVTSLTATACARSSSGAPASETAVTSRLSATRTSGPLPPPLRTRTQTAVPPTPSPGSRHSPRYEARTHDSNLPRGARRIDARLLANARPETTVFIYNTLEMCAKWSSPVTDTVSPLTSEQPTTLVQNTAISSRDIYPHRPHRSINTAK